MQKQRDNRKGLPLQYVVAALSLTIVIWNGIDACRYAGTRTVFHMTIFTLVFLLAVAEIIRIGRRKRR